MHFLEMERDVNQEVFLCDRMHVGKIVKQIN